MKSIVVDTNLFVAGFFNPGSASARILEYARAGEVRLLWTESMLQEARRVLRHMPVDPAYVEGVEGLFRPESKVEPPATAPEIPENPDDSKFVACAVGGQADMIVSNDRDLLEAPDTGGIPVYRPVDALPLLSA